jgi:uncharacterized membrane protein YvbJ
MKCDRCGNELETDSFYCQSCGNRIEQISKPINTNARKNYEQVVELSKEGILPLYVLLGVVVPFIGIILAIIWDRKYPSRSKSIVIGFIIGVFVAILLTFIIVFSNLNSFR